jgi:hypothetical protein
MPISPNWDEVSHGYNAYSILKTGMDEWGKTFPLIFRAFGDYKLPFYIYLTTLPVSLFGLNVFAVRFISALAGVLAIPGIYMLVRELFHLSPLTTQLSTLKSHPSTLKSHPSTLNSQLSTLKSHPSTLNLPLTSAFFLAISPWHFFISRPALEANLALTLIIFGAYYLLKFFNSQSSLLPAAILLGLSMHTYNTARVFVPLLVVSSLLIFKSSLRAIAWQSRKKDILAILLFAALSALVVFQVLSGEGSARYEKLKILSPSIVYQIGEARQNSTLPPILAKIIFNRPITFVVTATKNYFGYFSPQFFYQTWGAQFQFAIPGQNLLTLPVYLLAILGFFVTLSSLRFCLLPRTWIRGKRGNPALSVIPSEVEESHSTKSSQFLLAWLLLSPIAASLTADPPQALRPNPMIPALIIMASLGLSFLSDKVTKKYRSIVFVIIVTWVVFSFASYVYKYNSGYKVKYSSSWQFGYEKVMRFVKDHGSEYEKIFITKRYGEPHIFYSFFTQLEPRRLQPDDTNIRFSKTDWFWTDKIGNVYFINDWQIPKIEVSKLPLESGGEVSTARSLLVTSPDHVPVNAHVIETINFLDGTPAFIITSVP